MCSLRVSTLLCRICGSYADVSGSRRIVRGRVQIAPRPAGEEPASVSEAEESESEHESEPEAESKADPESEPESKLEFDSEFESEAESESEAT